MKIISGLIGKSAEFSPSPSGGRRKYPLSLWERVRVRAEAPCACDRLAETSSALALTLPSPKGRGFPISTALALIGLLAALPATAAEYYGQRPADDRWPTLQQEGPAPAADLQAANYYLILDGSGSMRDKDCGGGRSKIDVAKEAVLQFAQRVPASANLGLFAFDASGPSERLPLGVGNRDRFAEAVNAIKAYENTPLFTSIQTGYRQLTAQAQRQRGYGEYHLVVVTDGRSTDKDPMPMVQQILRESPVLVETIGFCIREKHSLNQPGLTFYQSANDPESLRRSLEAVLAESPDFNAAQFKP